MPNTTVICLTGADPDASDPVPRLAALLDGWLGPGTTLRVAPALELEMADDLADGDRLVIVRALRREGPAVEVRAVEAAPHGEYGRGLEPGHLIEVAWNVNGVRATAWLVTMAVSADGADDAVPQAAAAVRALLAG